MRFLFVDRIERIIKGRMARGHKIISFEEGFLAAPYPLTGEFPRLLILESTAQLASWLILYSTDFRKIPLLVRLEEVVILESVHAGERMEIEVELLSLREEAALLEAKVYREGRLIGTGKKCLCAFMDLETLADPLRIRAAFKELTRDVVLS